MINYINLMLWPCLRLMINAKVQISKQVKGKPHDMVNMSHSCIWRRTCFKVKGKHSQDFQLPLTLCSQNGDATCGSWDSQGVQNLCPKQLLKKENYILFEELRHKLPKIFSTTHMFIGRVKSSLIGY